VRKQLRVLVAALGLALVVPVVPVEPVPVAVVEATGECSFAFVTVWSGPDQTGLARTYCWLGQGVGDSNYSIETSTAMGPLSNGTYLPDFDTSSSTSGVTSYRFYDPAGGYDVIVCFYNSTGYNGLVQFDTASGYYNMGIGVNNVTESFAFTNNGNCP
jgi:hypothetical protein